MSGTPWYDFNRIDNLGGVEPFGGFPKPDSNIQLPAMYPITALLSGVVTAIDTASQWGTSITIRLTNPVNDLATHTAYLHLAGIAPGVHVGSQINAGQLIAFNGGASATGSQKVPLGFALYSGDSYGYGDAWGNMTKYNLQHKLSPVALLDSFKNGTSMPSNSTGGSDPCGPMPSDYWFNYQAASTWNSCKAAHAINGSGSSGSIATDASNSVTQALGIGQIASDMGAVGNFFTTFDFKDFTIRTALIIVGVVALILGLYIFVSK